MSPAERLASVEGFSGETERRKRLGQYFTGTSLGRVLAALAGVDKSSSVIDPMCGNGDLLVACAELGADASSMGAVDIDPIAIEACGKRLPESARVLGSAFDPGVLGRLPRLQWDLVIANPPYVRYQNISKGAGKDFPLPGAVEIRNGLISEIRMLPALDDTDRELFLKLAQGYSGLADLAVPSWILCAGLVTPGGRLALVVPEAWLTRDYATVVLYMLLRWFEIEFVVEDEHAAWFSDAQVKTTLLVAKRVPRKKGAFDSLEGRSFLRIVVSGKASGPDGPCSRLGQGKKEPERSFAKDARKWLSSGTGCEDDMVRAYHVPLSRIAANLRSSCSKQKWFAHMGESLEEEDSGPVVPHELEEWMARSPCAPRPVSLSSLGVSTGQGLRTGANSFFYAEIAEDGTIVFDKLLPGAGCHAPADIALPAVRKQEDLPSGFVVEPKTVRGRVLNLRHHALPEDIRSAGSIAASAYNEIPADLAGIVRTAALLPFGDGGKPKRIWELSAVAPNIRKGNPDKGEPPRFWYMLPDFARRHLPDLLMPRINTGSPRAWLNKDARCVIDANFATLWTDGPGPDKHALLAFLNSAWTAVALEHSAAVMGGGALKVEAAHLRRLPVPPMDAEILSRLSAFGKRLARAKTAKTIDGLLEKIDRTVISAALGREASDDDVKTLRGLAAEGRIKRRKHKNKKGFE